MALEPLSWLSTTLLDISSIDGDKPAYESNHAHAVAGIKVGGKKQPFTVQLYLSAWARDDYFKKLAANADSLDRQYFGDKIGILLRQAWLDGAKQNVVPISLRANVMTHQHNTAIFSHSETGQVYDTLRRSHYKPYGASDVYHFAWKYHLCQKHRSRLRPRRVWKLFPPKRPAEFIATHFLGSLPKIENGNKFIAAMTDGYFKSMNATPTKTTTATDAAQIFVDRWVVLYDINEHLLTYNAHSLLKSFSTPHVSHWSQDRWRQPPTANRQTDKPKDPTKQLLVDLFITLASTRTTEISLYSRWRTLETPKRTRREKRQRSVRHWLENRRQLKEWHVHRTSRSI